jgi:hypothetical protein
LFSETGSHFVAWGWPWTHSLPASTFWVLGLQACTTTPHFSVNVCVCVCVCVILGFELRAYTISHSMGVSWNICPGWLGTVILLISASWVARITGGREPQTPSFEDVFNSKWGSKSYHLREWVVYFRICQLYHIRLNFTDSG